MKIFPKNLSLRLITLLSVLFVLILSFIKISFPQKKPISLAPISLPTSTPKPTLFSTPTPTPVVRHFTSSRQNILITIPKYLDITNETETYEISFDKVSPSSEYYLTSETFPRLVIFDKNYEFSVAITKEIAGDPDKLNKAFTEINTNQFGILKKTVFDEGYLYFTDYYAVNLFPKKQTFPSFAFMTCRVIGKDQSECDQLISTLSIKLK